MGAIGGGPGIFLAESWKSLKTVTENQKSQKGSAENRKNICAGNQKMPFLSQGNPEKLENMVETGKYDLQFAETGKVLLKAVESWKSPKRQLKVAETGKKATARKAGKSIFFLRKARSRPPIPGPFGAKELEEFHTKECTPLKMNPH